MDYLRFRVFKMTKPHRDSRPACRAPVRPNARPKSSDDDVKVMDLPSRKWTSRLKKSWFSLDFPFYLAVFHDIPVQIGHLPCKSLYTPAIRSFDPVLGRSGRPCAPPCPTVARMARPAPPPPWASCARSPSPRTAPAGWPRAICRATSPAWRGQTIARYEAKSVDLPAQGWVRSMGLAAAAAAGPQRSMRL